MCAIHEVLASQEASIVIAKLQASLITGRQDDEQWMLMCTLSSWLSSIAICLALTISFVRMHSMLACHERSMTVGLTGHPIVSVLCRNILGSIYGCG